MKIIQSALNRFQNVLELLRFLWRRKLWWLIPMVVLLLVLVLFIFFAQTSGLAPLVYTFF